LKETTLEANADDHHRSEASISMPAALEDKQTQPKDLLAAMDSFDNLFCRRCLVQILVTSSFFVILNVFLIAHFP
jgi:hypothetical protein